MNAKRKCTREEREQMTKDTPTKTMTDAERQAIIRHYRIEALELIAPSLRVLEKSAGRDEACGPSGEDEELLLYRRQLGKMGMVAREIKDVLDVCRGKVGKSISEEDFRTAIHQARQRGLKKAGLATDEHEKTCSLSEPK
jgi:hypothetical protein